jgi:iron complex transport system ATP-binding protein
LASLALDSVTIGYSATVPVLTNVSFSLEPGSAIALIGPNGSGKSTLLKTVLDVISPLKGTVLLDGKPISQMTDDARAKAISFVPQTESHAFAFTGMELVMMGRLVHSAGMFESAEDRERALDAMRQTDCLEFADRRADELSGGERQRLLLARAFAQDTPVLLMDEPNSHLDLHHQLRQETYLKAYWGGGRSSLLAIHDLNMVIRLRIPAVLLVDGSATAPSSIEDLLASGALEHAYRTRFEMIGSGERRALLPLIAASG